MTRTLNGWTVINKPGATFVAPNGKTVYVRNADVAVVFNYITMRWHQEIEKLPKATYNLWPNERKGYIVIHGFRPYGAGVGVGNVSNHHSGTAMDILGDRHHYERSCSRANGGPGCWGNYKAHAYISGFNQAQHDKLRQIARAVVDGKGQTVIRLGIDFQRGWRDAMHVEIAPGVTSTELRQAADRIRAFRDVVEPIAEKITEATLPGRALAALGLPLTIEGLRAYQQAAGLVVDGKFGPKTRADMEETMKALDDLYDEIRNVPGRTISALMSRRPDASKSDRHHKFRYQDIESQLLYAANGGLLVPGMTESLAKIEAALGATPERVAELILPLVADAVRESLPDQQADEMAAAVVDALAKRLGRPNPQEAPQ